MRLELCLYHIPFHIYMSISYFNVHLYNKAIISWMQGFQESTSMHMYEYIRVLAKEWYSGAAPLYRIG